MATYADGRPVRLGDRLSLGGEAGEVVAVIDDGAYAEAFPEDAWGYLGVGFLVNIAAYGVIHYREAEADLLLVSRATGSSA